ncbi:MAG TPA: peptidoglycan -binding protein [Candidatus Acidoferrum sp.]|nr:peptidoglycan -binding protein [Candidatus Acidoferrum sp.]
MATIAAGRGRRRYFDPWPGYVDVLSTLLMVVIFVLIVFVIAQVFLSHALNESDTELLQKKSDLAAAEKTVAEQELDLKNLNARIQQLNDQLTGAQTETSETKQRLTVILSERDSLATGLADANAQLANTNDANETLKAQIAELLKNHEADQSALMATRAELDKAYKLSDENKAALLAALAQVEDTKKSAADTKAQLEAALAAARADAEKAGKLTAEQKAALDEKLAELAAAYKAMDADKEKIQTTLAELAALQKARDDLAKQAAEQQAALTAAQSASEQASKLSAEQKAQLEQKLAELENAYKTISADKEKIDTMLAEIAALQKLRDDLARQVADSQAALATAQSEKDQAFKTTADQKAALEQKLIELENAYKTIDADKAKVQALLGDIAALESLRDDLSKKLLASDEASKNNAAQAEKNANELAEEKKLSDTQRMQVELLNQQVLALRQQLAQLATALDASEAKAKEQGVQIADLGKRLNVALANKVAELASYRSEFFGKLKEVLGERPDIQIVGDRFVFQSEVLFDVGSADIEDAGKQQLGQFAKTLLEIAAKIPTDIDWILRVDGHTDKRPINTPQFHSNWELSSARAIAVVNFLQSQGVPANRLAAAGFAEFRPLDPTDDEIAYRRNRRIELKLDQR